MKSLEEYLTSFSFELPPQEEKPKLNAGERAFVEKYLGLETLEKLVPVQEPTPLASFPQGRGRPKIVEVVSPPPPESAPGTGSSKPAVIPETAARQKEESATSRAPAVEFEIVVAGAEAPDQGQPDAVAAIHEHAPAAAQSSATRTKTQKTGDRPARSKSATTVESVAAIVQKAARIFSDFNEMQPEANADANHPDAPMEAKDAASGPIIPTNRVGTLAGGEPEPEVQLEALEAESAEPALPRSQPAPGIIVAPAPLPEPEAPTIVVAPTIDEIPELQAPSDAPIDETGQAAVFAMTEEEPADTPSIQATLEDSERVELAASVVEEPGAVEQVVPEAVEAIAWETAEIQEPESPPLAEKNATSQAEELVEELAVAQATDVATVEAVASTVAASADSLEDARERLERQVSLREKLKQAREVQVVSFFVAGQLFLLPVEGIQEVLKHVELVKVPRAPAFVAGVINLRGKITPLVHLSALLTKTEPVYDDHKFIIIYGTESLQLGLIIDKISSMHMLTQNKIIWNVEAKLGADAADYLSAIVDLDDKVCGMVAPEMITQKILAF